MCMYIFPMCIHVGYRPVMCNCHLTAGRTNK